MSKANTHTVPEHSPFEFKSGLDQSWQRFMAAAVEHGLRIGRRQPSDFLRHFSAPDIMEGLRERPELRAGILERTTGIKRSIAVRKTASSSGVDLALALDENETDAATIVGLLEPDDIVRHLNRERLWHYVTEDEFWTSTPACPDQFETAQQHVAFLMERTLAEGLVSHRDIIEGLTADRIAECLPRAVLSSILLRALEEGHINRGFTEEHLLAVVPPAVLVQHVPLAHIWNAVVVPKVAKVHGFERSEKVAATAHAPARAKTLPSAVEISPELQDVHVTELVVDDPEDGDDFSMLVTPLPATAPTKKSSAGATTRGKNNKNSARPARSKRAPTSTLTTGQLGN